MKKTGADLKKLVAGRQVLIWGAMIVGQGICRALERHGIAIDGFVDSSPALQGRTALEYPIGSSQQFIKQTPTREKVVIIASGHYDLEIEQLCTDAGLKKDIHYIMSCELNDIDPSVDIAGMCNLKCISCPRGNMKDSVPGGFMTPDTYRPILDKLLRELPFLGSIQLYTWGEPLLNPHLAEIVKLTRKAKVLTALSSNLNAPKGYKEVVEAGLDWFKVSASGFEQSYEITHTGGKWDRFLKNLHEIVKLRRKHHPGMQIIVNYHLYKHNIGEDYKKMEALCKELDIIFRPSPAYLYPLENVRAYMDGRPLSPQAEQTLGLLLMGLDQGIEKALKLKDQRCPEERCLPITWEGKVKFCGVYYKPLISEDFLSVSIKDLISKRISSDFCKACKQKGLHQFTGVYLAEKVMEQGKGFDA